MKEKIKFIAFGTLAGLCNGLFGSGGGMVVVPFLKKTGLPAAVSHATAIAVILPLTVFSIWRYASFGSVDTAVLTKACIGGVAGGIIGSKLMKRFSPSFLRYGFSAVAIIAAVRMVMS